MIPLVATLVGLLADKGLDLLTGAIEGGADKAVEFIAEKSGIDVSKKTKLSNEDVKKLKEVEDKYSLELGELALLNKQEDNRHEEMLVTTEVEDMADARDSNHLYDMQHDIGKTVFIQTSILIPALIIIDVVLSVFAGDLGMDGVIHGAMSTLIGIALNNAYRERQSLLEFLYGSSVGSKLKDMAKKK